MEQHLRRFLATIRAQYLRLAHAKRLDRSACRRQMKSCGAAVRDNAILIWDAIEIGCHLPTDSRPQLVVDLVGPIPARRGQTERMTPIREIVEGGKVHRIPLG